MKKPTAEDKRDGLKPKYHITHVDGSPCDPRAKYFVLRLDFHKGCDEHHIGACRAAALEYADGIRLHLPALSRDLIDLVVSTMPKGGRG